MDSARTSDAADQLPAQRRSDDAIEIYVYRDARGMPLYVGITGRPAQREAEHVYRSKWIRYKAGKESLEYAETMDDALAREAYLIRRLKPVFNIQQQAVDWRERRRAYLTLYDPDVMSTDDGAVLLMDPEAVQVAPDGTVGKATAFVMAQWKGTDERVRHMLLTLAREQDAGNGYCAFLPAGSTRGFIKGPDHDVVVDRVWASGWMTRYQTDHIGILKLGGFREAHPIRIAMCQEDLDEAIAARAKASRRRR